MTATSFFKTATAVIIACGGALCVGETMSSGLLLAQGVSVEGRWIGYQSLSRSTVFVPNHADGSALSLPGFQDPNPPRVYMFEFKADGTYEFVSGVGQTVWATHKGRYQTARGAGPESSRYPFLLTIVPDPATVTVNPSRGPLPPGIRDLERGAAFRLRERDGELRLLDSRVSGRDADNDIGMFSLAPMGR